MCTWSESLLLVRSRLLRLGVLDETKAALDYVLALKPAVRQRR